MNFYIIFVNLCFMGIAGQKGKWLKEEVDKLSASGRSQAQIAEILGISPQQFNNVLSGRASISDKFIDKFVEAFEIHEICLSSKDFIPNSRKKIPLYDVESIGGHNDVAADTNTSVGHVAEWIDAGDWFPEATAAIRHYGDSMLEYPSGSILALKRVEDLSLLINGRNYVIETSEFRITKQLQDDGDSIIAYSSNRETYPDGRQIHAPIRIPKASIRHIDLVLGCVLKEYSNGPIPIIRK